MSTNNFLIDASTRHAVFVQRYGAGQSVEAQRLLVRLKNEIQLRLAREPTVFQQQRLQILLNDIEALSVQTFDNLKNTVSANAQTFAESEARFNGDMLDRVTKPDVSFEIPSSEQLSTGVRLAPMRVNLAGSGGLTIDDALLQYGKAKRLEITRTITDGVLLGDPTPKISRNVAQVINTRHRRQVDSLVRTITNHVSSVARDETYKANQDVLNGYEWVSTLDAATTLTCAGRDGKIYQVGGPMPPAHWGCRSTTIPAVKPEFTLAKLDGQRSAKGDKTGPVNGQVTYGSWLAKQSKSFQDEALGPERAELFRSGGLKITDFTDNTGEVYTLAQLEALHPEAFTK